jgi:hypothetical protein
MKTNWTKHCQDISITLFLLSCGVAVQGQSPTQERPQPVSLIRVIANPERFDGQKLRVIGVLGYGGGLDEAKCLYVSEADSRNAVMPNCISLDLAKAIDRSDKRLGKYVILNATFHYVSGHPLESLSLDGISEIKLWGSSEER